MDTLRDEQIECQVRKALDLGRWNSVGRDFLHPCQEPRSFMQIPGIQGNTGEDVCQSQGFRSCCDIGQVTSPQFPLKHIGF